MNRLTSARAAVGALALILVTTAAWWALALWPVGPEAPEWFLRTRDVCFGAKVDTLPTAGGWLLLVGQPVGMVALLAAVWGRDLKAGIALTLARAFGQVTIGIVMALLVAGVVGVAARVRSSYQEPFSVGAVDLASQLTRVSDVAPPLALVDQAGREVTLASFRGCPVLVAFAFAHCQTVCPLIVSDVLAARGRFEGNQPAVLLITLDPWRDTPSRLPSIAKL